MSTQPPSSHNIAPLRPSSSKNTGKLHTSKGKHTFETSALLPSRGNRDENVSPLAQNDGATLAHELSRAGVHLDTSIAPLPENLQEADDAIMMFDNLVASIDNANNETALSEILIELFNSTTILLEDGSTMVPSDVTHHDGRIAHEPVISKYDTDKAVDTSLSQKSAQASNASRTSENYHHSKDACTLRERRLQYLRDMYSVANKRAPTLPSALHRSAALAPARIKWKIEGGVVGAWLQCPVRKAPEYAVKYGGSPQQCLRAKRLDLNRLIREREMAKRRESGLDVEEDTIREVLQVDELNAAQTAAIAAVEAAELVT